VRINMAFPKCAFDAYRISSARALENPDKTPKGCPGANLLRHPDKHRVRRLVGAAACSLRQDHFRMSACAADPDQIDRDFEYARSRERPRLGGIRNSKDNTPMLLANGSATKPCLQCSPLVSMPG
jgi:hypothetical protein